MSKLNNEAAPNNNLAPEDVKASKVVAKKEEHEFSEELSDGGERNENIEKLDKPTRGVRLI